MILGITGKSGAGKHTAASFFEQRNWKILDADKMAHRLYYPYQRVWREVTEHFGEEVLKKDDKIDRQKLKQIVFQNTQESKKALEDLNAIVHPELARVLKDEAYYLGKKKKNTIIVAALWKELNLFEICDKVLLVQAGEALTFERIKKRDGIDFSMFESQVCCQSEPENADFTVTNEADFQELYKQLNKITTEL